MKLMMDELFGYVRDLVRVCCFLRIVVGHRRWNIHVRLVSSHLTSLQWVVITRRFIFFVSAFFFLLMFLVVVILGCCQCLEFSIREPHLHILSLCVAFRSYLSCTILVIYFSSTVLVTIDIIFLLWSLSRKKKENINQEIFWYSFLMILTDRSL